MVTALMGVHTIGRAHPQFSGYDGPWTRDKDAGKFDNGYYKVMLEEGWGAKTIGPKNHQWDPITMNASPGEKKMMMLNTDMCLGWSKNTLHADCMRKNNFRGTRKCK